MQTGLFKGQTINSLLEKKVLERAGGTKLKVAKEFKGAGAYPHKDGRRVRRIGSESVTFNKQHYPTTAKEIAKMLGDKYD